MQKQQQQQKVGIAGPKRRRTFTCGCGQSKRRNSPPRHAGGRKSRYTDEFIAKQINTFVDVKEKKTERERGEFSSYASTKLT